MTIGKTGTGAARPHLLGRRRGRGTSTDGVAAGRPMLVGLINL